MKRNTILKTVKNLDPVSSLYVYIRVFCLHNSSIEPIIIYQMGKVGSSSIYKTLKILDLENSIYHVHSLSKKRINKAFQRNKMGKGVSLPLHFKLSKFLTEKINVQKDKIKIISLTREPIGRIISRFFQNIHYASPELILSENKIDFLALQDQIIRFFSEIDMTFEDATTWFDREFKEALGVDAYSFPFDKEKGYQIFSTQNIDCLVIKLERLNEVGCEALNTFLSTDRVGTVQNANIGSQKDFSSDYQKMKRDIRFGTDILNKFYSTKYMTHFYTADEISGFMKKWSR